MAIAIPYKRIKIRHERQSHRQGGQIFPILIQISVQLFVYVSPIGAKCQKRAIASHPNMGKFFKKIGY